MKQIEALKLQSTCGQPSQFKVITPKYTYLRKRLQRRSLTVCMLIKTNGPSTAETDDQKALEVFL